MKSEHTLHMTQERTFMSGVLSVSTTFRLMVTGDTELKHLDRLIRILRMQQTILAEDEEARPDIMPDVAWYCPPHLIENSAS